MEFVFSHKLITSRFSFWSRWLRRGAIKGTKPQSTTAWASSGVCFAISENVLATVLLNDNSGSYHLSSQLQTQSHINVCVISFTYSIPNSTARKTVFNSIILFSPIHGGIDISMKVQNFVHNNTCITETELLTWIARNRGVMTPVSTRYWESCGVWRAIWPQAPAATSFTAGSNSASIEIRGWIAPQFTTACDKGGECFATALSIHAAAFLLSRCASLQ